MYIFYLVFSSACSVAFKDFFLQAAKCIYSFLQMVMLGLLYWDNVA